MISAARTALAPIARIARDVRTICSMAMPPGGASSQAERLSRFYGRQAADYDRFRERLLHGRAELVRAVPLPARDGVWVDMGGGTASNLALLGPRLQQLRRVYVVDLARPLLRVAQARVTDQGWHNVQLMEADARDAPLRAGSADLVTFSYSLSMMPDWFATVDHAIELLKPGGCLGVADFYVSRKRVAAGTVRHSWWTRALCPLWFAHDDVFLNADHLPYLHYRLQTLSVREGTGPVPFLPGLRVPYYVWVGVKADHQRVRPSRPPVVTSFA